MTKYKALQVLENYQFLEAWGWLKKLGRL